MTNDQIADVGKKVSKKCGSKYESIDTNDIVIAKVGNGFITDPDGNVIRELTKQETIAYFAEPIATFGYENTQESGEGVE